MITNNQDLKILMLEIELLFFSTNIKEIVMQAKRFYGG